MDFPFCALFPSTNSNSPGPSSFAGPTIFLPSYSSGSAAGPIISPAAAASPITGSLSPTAQGYSSRSKIHAALNPSPHIFVELNPFKIPVNPVHTSAGPSQLIYGLPS
ncbi:hypothetical protein ACOSQ4_028533 [Xanthoceras sorbifolium]